MCGTLSEGKLLILCPLVHLKGLCGTVREGGGGTLSGLGGSLGGEGGAIGGLAFLLNLSKELLMDLCGASVSRLLIGGSMSCELCGLFIALGLKPLLLCGKHVGAFALSRMC